MPYVLILKHTNLTPIDCPQGGRNVETLGTSKHCSPSGCDHGAFRTYFGLDARRRPPKVHYKASRCEQTLSGEHPSYHHVVRTVDSLTSYPMLPKASIISILAI